MTVSLLEELCVELGMGASDLKRIITSAPRRYKVYQIPKRHGGQRTIAQPARDLKLIQRYLLDYTLSKFPIHPAAMGYVENRSISHNARLHVGSKFLLKLDFRDFFPSIKVADWEKVAKSTQSSLSVEDIKLCSLIMFWGQGGPLPRCLSIGAPTSPALSNIIMHSIDTRLAATASKLGIIYSRYADDITASADTVEALSEFERFVRSLIARTRSPSLSINESKRGLYGKGQRRLVTGLVITPDRRVSIGRERKRLISAMTHKAASGTASLEQIARLKGLLGFCISTEPAFVSRLRGKYGNRVIDEVLRAEVPGRLLRMAAQTRESEGGASDPLE